MKKILIVLTLSLLSGCSVYGGFAVHPTSLDKPEIGLENPIGFLGGEARVLTDKDLTVDLFAEHHSGLFQAEQGAGLNMVGVRAKVKMY